MMEAQIAEALRKRAARLRARDDAPGGRARGSVPNVLVQLAEEIEAALDEQVEAVERLRSRLRDARGRGGDRAGAAPEQVAERDEPAAEVERSEDVASESGHALPVDAVLTAIRLALNEEGGTHGWRPPRGVDPVLDLALDVREERDRLRGAR